MGKEVNMLEHLRDLWRRGPFMKGGFIAIFAAEVALASFLLAPFFVEETISRVRLEGICLGHVSASLLLLAVAILFFVQAEREGEFNR